MGAVWWLMLCSSDDRMLAASAPFAMDKFALQGLAQSIARELATCLDQVPKKKLSIEHNLTPNIHVRRIE
jgi:hypothetical protein